MRRNFRSQHGSSATGFIWLVLSAVMGAGLFALFLCWSGGTPPKIIPYALAGGVTASATACTVLLNKLFELKDQAGLNRDEQRRLKHILKEKINRVVFVMLSLVISGIAMIASFSFLSGNPEWFIRALVATGALSGISVYVLFWTFSVTNEITTFKADLTNREEAKKKQRAALKHLKKKPS